MAKVSIEDVLRLGQEGAGLKGSMSRKRWKRFVKAAHDRGYTVRSAASDTPDALKERTRSSLQKEAASTIAAMYAPARKELSQRETSIGFLNQKRADDDAKYRQWLMGETDKLEAQARAADETLAKQQGDIARDHETATKAALADSMQRMGATPGNVSDPSQSAALADTKDADDASSSKIASARNFTADTAKIGEDSRQLTRASLIAQQGARDASRQGDTWRAMAEVASDREKLVLQQAADAASLVQDLFSQNAEKVKGAREFDLARVELGQKADSLAAEVAEANRKFRLEEKKFDLERFTARNKVLVDQAKIQLGYDQIENTQGKQKADAELRKWVERYKARQRVKENRDDPKKGGITTEERTLYRDVLSASRKIAGLNADWKAGKKGAIAPAKHRNYLMNEYGLDEATINVALDLYRNGGKLSSSGRAQARKLGITHVGYFF